MAAHNKPKSAEANNLGKFFSKKSNVVPQCDAELTRKRRAAEKRLEQIELEKELNYLED